MPRQDGTGPNGQGPMTGRGLGPCGRGMRRGFGQGFGRGMGWRCCERFQSLGQANLTKEDEKKILEADLKDLEAEKEAVQKRLKELK